MSLKFNDGGLGRYDVAEHADWQSASWTTEAWVKYDDATNSRHRIISHQNTDYWLMAVYGGKLEVGSSRDGILSTNTGVTNVSDNVWHHLAVVRNAGSYVRTYVDGVLDKSFAITDSGAYASATLLPIGDFYAGGETITAIIDELRYWNVARTLEQIQAYRFKRLFSTAGLKLSLKTWVLSPPATLPDWSSSGHPGTKNGTQFNDVDSPPVVHGHGSAMSLANLEGSVVVPTESVVERYAPAPARLRYRPDPARPRLGLPRSVVRVLA